MVNLNLSSQSMQQLSEMYEARIDALQNNIEKLKLIIKSSTTAKNQN